MMPLSTRQTVLPATHCVDSLCCDSGVNQLLTHRLSAFLTKLLVCFLCSKVVSMPLYLHGCGGICSEIRGDLPNLALGICIHG